MLKIKIDFVPGLRTESSAFENQMSGTELVLDENLSGQSLQIRKHFHEIVWEIRYNDDDSGSFDSRLLL